MSSLVPSADLERLFDVPFTFVQRPKAVPGSLRPAWRIPALLLAVRRCWGGKANLEQLHVLNWAIRDAQGREGFLSFWRGELEPDEAVVRFEPALNRAIDLALGLRLLIWTDAKRLTLTEQGKALLGEIDEQEDVLADEKSFLNALDSPVTQTGVAKLLRRGRR